MKRLKTAFDVLCARLYVWAVVQVTTEPVRVRAWLVSALLACSVVVPAFADHRTDEAIAGVLVTALTVVAGESARSKVTPTDSK
ncbi:hypothetical protein [Streptomyces asiaticus]|uniref:hypothetical protein n=1 Tax=Streptomyces asiaticus TaxID=114695 RepID=UPI001BADC0D4|nr:hypothetical protein [Streptomyces asiaticus]